MRGGLRIATHDGSGFPPLTLVLALIKVVHSNIGLGAQSLHTGDLPQKRRSWILNDPRDACLLTGGYDFETGSDYAVAKLSSANVGIIEAGDAPRKIIRSQTSRHAAADRRSTSRGKRVAGDGQHDPATLATSDKQNYVTHGAFGEQVVTESDVEQKRVGPTSERDLAAYSPDPAKQVYEDVAALRKGGFGIGAPPSTNACRDFAQRRR